MSTDQPAQDSLRAAGSPPVDMDVAAAAKPVASSGLTSSVSAVSIEIPLAEDTALDLEREAGRYCVVIRSRLQITWDELHQLEVTLSKTKGRLSKHHLQEEVMLSQSEVWQRAQAEDMQTVWGHVNTIERLCGDGFVRSRMLKERIDPVQGI